MGHFVTGIIINKNDVESISQVIPFSRCCGMRKGFVIFPLNDELIDQHFPSPQEYHFEEFAYLSRQMDELFKKASMGISFLIH